jgi:salicylate hydroxylase
VRDRWTRESWTERGDLADALAAFDGWHPQVRAILAAAEQPFLWGLFDRVPLERWTRGRVALLGDAAHAMLPFMAQGAAQAIEDGATLAACLQRAGSDVPAALRRYERLRIPRASRLQALSADNKLRFHLPDGPEQRRRDARMAAGATDWSFEAVAWIYGHDPGDPDQEPAQRLAGGR